MRKFALAGNPNSGKTTLFNSLTGSTAHVGNWPGVTVDKREGSYRKLGEPIYIVDLPGIYSLSPYTPEEVISRNYILEEKPDCVINIVDATNLERNLYLTTQLLEIDVPVVVALNMSDVVRKNGDKIDAQSLSEKLGVPVVEISALKQENLDVLMGEAVKATNKERKGSTIIGDKDLLHLINDVQIALELKGIENPLFHAVKLVELDELETAMHPDLVDTVNKFKATFKNETFGSDFEALIADERYDDIAKNYATALTKAPKQKGEKGEEKLTKSDKIDKVLTHRIWALPLFAVIMFFIFHFTFSEDLFFLNRIFGLEIANEGWVNFFTGMGYEGEPLGGIPSIGVWLQSWFGWATGSLIDLVGSGFEAAGVADSWYASLVCDGLLGGLDAVLSFIPQIMILFLFIAILEDSGYMARVAFILDRAFRKFGLSGKAFIPMLTGFGCSVPAIMAT
jgi:ferrous iron transport protein B